MHSFSPEYSCVVATSNKGLEKRMWWWFVVLHFFANLSKKAVTWLKHSSTSRATFSSLMSPRMDQPWDICVAGEEHGVSRIPGHNGGTSIHAAAPP